MAVVYLYLFIAEMINIQHQLGAVEEVLRQILEQLDIAGEGHVQFEELLKDFIRESNETDELMKTLLKFYQKQAENNDVPSPTRLSPEQIATITSELKVFENICNLKIRAGDGTDSAELLHPSVFKDFGDDVREKCPLLHSIVEALVLTSQQERNVHKTNKKKVLSGHHALALLYNIRNSNCCNDFPLLFGLLCVSYGAGKQFINMLQSIGVSLHFDTM